MTRMADWTPDQGGRDRPTPDIAPALGKVGSEARAEDAVSRSGVSYTVGYQGHDVDSFAAAVRRAGVTTVVDTRLHPTSRRPDFRREALRRRLETEGIRYVSEPRLGVPKRVRPLATSRPWLFRAAYRGVLSRSPAAVEETLRIARCETIALLCFEAEARECHRSLLADVLAAAAPIRFVHLAGRRVEDADDHPVPEHMMGAHH